MNMEEAQVKKIQLATRVEVSNQTQNFTSTSARPFSITLHDLPRVVPNALCHGGVAVPDLSLQSSK